MIVDTVFYKELESRNNYKSKLYTSFILPVFHDMDTFLENIKRDFPEYPDHGIKHSKRILEKLGLVISEKTIQEMSTLEIVILILSTLFHDSAMALFNSNEDKETIRREHHKLSSKVINKYFDSFLLNMPEQRRVRKAVIFVCEAHNLTMEELLNDKRFAYVDTIDTFKVHYGILAFLLRIGDLLDLEAERINCFRMMMFSDSFSEVSFNHNNRSENLDIYDCDPENIVITVTADTIEQYFIWEEWFAFLKQDTEKFNALFAGKYFRLPIPKTEITRSDGAKFEVKKLRLDIDENGGLWNVISKSIYTYDLDFLREMLQNSIDASLKSVYLNPDIRLSKASPRDWGKHADKVIVVYSEKKQTLCVIDHGIGMNISDLDHFLFKVSSSGKAKCEGRSFDFPGIAQYGIGFVSCLINADKIDVFTSNDGKTMNKATLMNNSTSALVEIMDNNDNYKGTTVCLKLKRQYADNAIESYIHNTFLYPSVPIEYYCIDRLNNFIDSDTLNMLVSVIKDNPYKFDRIIQRYSKVINTQQQLKLKEIDLLEQHESEFYSFERSLTKNNKNKKKLIQSINKNINNTDCNNPIIKDYLNKLREKLVVSKDIETTLNDLYDDTAHSVRRQLNEVKEKAEFLQFPACFDTGSVEINKDWNYMFIEVDSKLKIKYSEATKSKQPISLNYRTGIVFIKQNLRDYKRGIECSCINGFLIKKGKLVGSLVKKKRATDYKETNYNASIDKRENIITISNNEFVDINNRALFLPVIRYSNGKVPEASLSDLLDRSKYPFVQDGIRVSSRMINFFPLGISRMTCNFTAGARVKLNVTRHDISEARDDVDEWIQNTVNYIQRRFVKGIENALSDLNIDYFDELYNCVDYLLDENSYIDNELQRNLKKILYPYYIE